MTCFVATDRFDLWGRDDLGVPSQFSEAAAAILLAASENIERGGKGAERWTARLYVGWSNLSNSWHMTGDEHVVMVWTMTKMTKIHQFHQKSKASECTLPGKGRKGRRERNGARSGATSAPNGDIKSSDSHRLSRAVVKIWSRSGRFWCWKKFHLSLCVYYLYIICIMLIQCYAYIMYHIPFATHFCIILGISYCDWWRYGGIFVIRHVFAKESEQPFSLEVLHDLDHIYIL